jgi:hypothetical protein
MVGSEKLLPRKTFFFGAIPCEGSLGKSRIKTGFGLKQLND